MLSLDTYLGISNLHTMVLTVGHGHDKSQQSKHQQYGTNEANVIHIKAPIERLIAIIDRVLGSQPKTFGQKSRAAQVSRVIWVEISSVAQQGDQDDDWNRHSEQ
jgi:hypothetical protein